MGKDINIESYDGNDAFYTGTDEEYQEFLRNADIQMNGESAEPVENTQRINLSDTINLQSVIDRFKKTAGEIKDTVVNKVDEIKSKKDIGAFAQKTEELAEDVKEAFDETSIKEKVKNVAAKANELRDNVSTSARVETRLVDVTSDVAELKKKICDISDKLNVMEVQDGQRGKDSEQGFADIQNAIENIAENVSEIKHTVGAVSKLNDSLFDLRNTLLNTKNALMETETNVLRLKKKCVLGVTVLSILSAIVIVLEIILMLS